ncbi:MAG: SDR family oxidoreductase [Myxococcota bacterium]|nr:SDR family oxidoreductase [Myxococcota bacterium]
MFITGGSSGIGLSAGALFAAMGCHVAIFARNKDRLAEAVQRIAARKKAADQRFTWYAVDVTDDAAVHDIMGKAVRETGVPSILINSAGRALPRYFEEITARQFEETLRINVCGMRNTIAALLPHMLRDRGYIVNVSSVAGLIGVFGYTDYCASKFAIIGFSEALRAELKPRGITVSVLCPPDTDTPGFEEENKTKPPETAAISKNAKTMQPEDVARVMIRGMKKGKFLILANMESKFSALAKQLLPGLVEKIMDRAVASVSKETIS